MQTNGAPDNMTYDGAKEEIERNTEFQRVMRKYKIKGYVTAKNGQTKIRQKDAYENYDGDSIVPCSGHISPEPCGVMGYPM